MEYLLVKFVEKRQVKIDTILFDQTTGEVIELEGGYHLVTLADPQDFEPEEIEVDLKDTTELEPHEIQFTKKG